MVTIIYPKARIIIYHYLYYFLAVLIAGVIYVRCTPPVDPMYYLIQIMYLGSCRFIMIN